ncbi:hypothetical protein KBI33_00265 [Candidatus Shapirobacteria bacterium]|nr:hypothetical protein [Candidatus Shapirobacteria bacterium]
MSFLTRFFSRLRASKRVRFVFSSLFLGLIFLLIQQLPFPQRYWGIGGLLILSISLHFFSLYEGLNFNVERLLTPILPSFFSLGVSLFYFLLPSSWPYQLLIFALFSFGMYVIFLTENIFTVASLRTIALARAAQAVGFLLTLLSLFFLYDAIFSFRLSFWKNAILASFFTFPLTLHSLWAVNLEESLSRDDLLLALIFSLVAGEFSLIISFYPVEILMGSLFLTTVSYVLLGLGSAQRADRLFKRTAQEYLIVGSLMFLGLFLTTSWRG